MDWMLRHKIISLIVVIALAIAAWYFLSGSSSSEPVLATQSAAAAPDGTQDLIQSLLALKAVSLSGTIFSDPAYQSLRDFSTPVVPEPVGRTDPFAPLSGEAQPSQTSTQSAQQFAPKQ